MVGTKLAALWQQQWAGETCPRFYVTELRLKVKPAAFALQVQRSNVTLSHGQEYKFKTTLAESLDWRINNTYAPIYRLVCAVFIEGVVKAKCLIFQELSEVDFLLRLVNDNNVFVRNSHDINFFSFDLCTSHDTCSHSTAHTNPLQMYTLSLLNLYYIKLLLFHMLAYIRPQGLYEFLLVESVNKS